MRRSSFALLLTIAMAGCASTGGVPRPFPLPGGAVPPTTPRAPGLPPRPTAPSPPAGPADGYAISTTALAFRGAPYRNGGNDPTSGFDCSGFVQYVYGQHGVQMPREVRQQYSFGHDVDPRQLEPGDLLFFTTIAPGASHVGISVGGDQFIHAPSSAGVVRVENLGSQYWANRFVGAKRIN